MHRLPRRGGVAPLVLTWVALSGLFVFSSALPSPRATTVHPMATHAVVAIALPTSDFVPNPVVWLVGVESFRPGPAADGRSTVTLGSGFVVRAGTGGAWVATAGHVVGSDGVAVYLVGSRRPHLADRLVRSGSADLALLHVPSLSGVTPAPLSGVPASAWGVEVACVRWPGWSYQSYPVPVGPRSFTSLSGIGPVLRTPTLAVLPGCSGGPLIAYSSRRGEAPTIVGVTTDALSDPTGVGYVPTAAVLALLREVR